MKDIIGRPGTKVSLCLRIGQCIFSTATFAMTLSSLKSTVYNTTANCFFILVIGVEIIWTFLLIALDAYALWVKKDLRTRLIFTIILVGDMMAFHLLLAVTSSVAAVVVFYADTYVHCNVKHGICHQMMCITKLAFTTTCLSGISAYIVAFNWPSIILA